MASTSTSKGTRKTYSFEEREILVNLIYKYLSDNEEEKLTEGNVASGGKRKSVWSEITEEYNSLVSPENARSSLQLRRCWENMKANKKNRDDKKVNEKPSVDDAQGQLPNSAQLPPNVVFQPKESEPFAFEGIMPPTDHTFNDSKVDVEEELQNNDQKVANDGSAEDNVPVALNIKRKVKSSKTPVKQKVPKISQINSSNQLNEFAILEAQLRLDTAALLKEEAKLKLKEAQFKQEEARLRMVCASYKLQKLKEDYADCVDCVIEEKEEDET
ncbi:uncharacterized protein LOC131663593 [Phymastichus coffea]|uniref:uncharacterized protein LOC131663593 n=1 Tax=Phymastichus coffea TaxID=108790 RepID=UPI00273B7708|nr:uncharacterized protein LOC131663593 [Phymastichus coffea]